MANPTDQACDIYNVWHLKLKPNPNIDGVLSVLFETRIKKVKEYYTGKKVDFKDCQLNLDNYTNFQKKVLQIVKEIPYGEIRSYKEAAGAAGYSRAYRAVGNTMRNNPLPLIIPCHRVIKTDGSLGGFSGKEGVALKRKMIDLESKAKQGIV